jgi:hypothetical protein
VVHVNAACAGNHAPHWCRVRAVSLFLLLSIPSLCYAGGGLRGFVTDSTTGEALIFANVLVRGTHTGGTTNTRGYYFLPEVPAGPQKITISIIGYRTSTLSVVIAEDEITQRDVRMVPGSIEMDEVLVERQTTSRPTDTDLGMTRISAREIALVPPGLESDIFRVLQTDPGVGTTGDVSARYYVRGGSGDQNLLLLNGTPIYNPFHALGIFSVIDPEVIAAMEFLKGGFAAEHSGRLSSVLNVVTRDGNKNRPGAAAQVGLLSGKLLLEGPVPGGSFLVAGRKSYSAHALQRYLPGKDNPFDFYDLSFKVNSASPALGENSKLLLHGFLSDDRVRNDDPLQEDYYVRNDVVGLIWQKAWRSPLVSSVDIGYSGFDGEVLPNESSARARNNTVHDLHLSADLTYIYPSRDELAFGVRTSLVSTALTMENLYGTLHTFEQKGGDLHAYASYRFQHWETFGFTIGTRIRFLSLTKTQPTFIEPRLNATFAPDPTLAFKFAAGWYAQEMVTLGDETEVVSVFDPWTIVPDYLSPPQAVHFIAGIEKQITDNLKLGLEAYYKPMNDLIDINPAKFTARASDFINVPGRSYGMEWVVRFDSGPLTVQGTYALSKAERTLHNEVYIPKYDVRHNLHVLAAWSPGDTWRLSATWAFKSGLPFTPIAGYYDRLVLTPESPNDVSGPTESVTLWGKRNSGRLPVYHRLDLSIARDFPIDALSATVELSLLNLYDRKNIFYFQRDTGEEVTMLRFFPSFSLRVAY